MKTIIEGSLLNVNTPPHCCFLTINGCYVTTGAGEIVKWLKCVKVVAVEKVRLE